ncbi:Retrovirus-related Pol polyprotein from transposon [Apostichopus japonicus]|uniref:Retrovirus-related Pol polyprotein from transposon n=1 Tax=Stichopus japonicus TaxID=307972 RepID=A0A2G8JCJ7_STIJA|nr:Retrovirus-related Pol polyprotein from transposon [Apostichopus japonicus]
MLGLWKVWPYKEKLSGTIPRRHHRKVISGKRKGTGLEGRRPAVNSRPAGVSVRTGWVQDRDSGIFVDGIMQGTAVTFLVDTGANITIIKPSVYRSIPEFCRPHLRPVGSEMVLADGLSYLPFEGCATVQIELAGHRVEHTVWVAEIGADALLGLEFMRSHNYHLDVINGILSWGGPRKSSEVKKVTETHVCHVLVDETVVVAPGSEAMVLGRISEGPRHWEAALVEPTEKFVEKHCLLVAKGLVDPRKSKIPLRVFNPTSDVKRVYGGTCIASLEETANLDVSFPETERQQQKVSAVSTKRCEQGEVPQHVTGLLEAEDGYMNDEQRALLKELVTDYADVFARSSADLGYTTVAQHKIDTDNARPVKQPARRVPVQQREVERELLQQMLDAGVVEPSSSPWASPIVLVKKKNGSTRFCVDYRRLNTLTVKDSYPIPRIADSLDAMAGSRWFSTLDLASGYWQVGMAAEDRQKTAFITGNGLYQFRVMPFGLCNAPATFERLMDRVLSGLHWEACLVYLDDVIVYGATFSEAMDRLKTVFNRFRDAGLKLSPGKCQLFKQSVTYLGHIVSKDGVGTDPEKVKAVKEWPRPQNLSKLGAL